VLFLAEDDQGRRFSWEQTCRASDAHSDAEVLEALTTEAQHDFRERNITRFCIAFAATVTSTYKAGPGAPPTPHRRTALLVEYHSADGEHLGATREIDGDRLLALGPLGDVSESRYAHLLDERVAG
jgi:hypothetical protein